MHQRHHQNGSNVTALGTAFGDAADIGLCFVAFHGLLVFALWALPRWNIVHVVALIGFEVQSFLWPCRKPSCSPYPLATMLAASMLLLGMCTHDVAHS